MLNNIQALVSEQSIVCHSENRGSIKTQSALEAGDDNSPALNALAISFASRFESVGIHRRQNVDPRRVHQLPNVVVSSIIRQQILLMIN